MLTFTTSSSSSNNNAGAYTTIKETVTFEKEIKKSKFIAIAGHVSNERSAHSFLSQVGILVLLAIAGLTRLEINIRLTTMVSHRELLANLYILQLFPQIPMRVEVPFELLAVLYHQLQSFQVEDIKQDYDTGKDGITMVTFKVDFDRVENLDGAIRTNC